MKNNLYFYKAEIVSVYDGDSVTAIIDMGLHTFRKLKVRLSGIDAPELRGLEKEAGKLSRDALRDLINGKTVFIKTTLDKRDKYGRLLGEIWFNSQKESYISVNNYMVKHGYAELY